MRRCRRALATFLLHRSHMWFDGWMDLARTAVVGLVSYVVLVLLLRVSGKRTLSKMNAFDFVVTIALGSAFSSVLLDKSIALAEGLLAFAMLIGLQRAVAHLTVHSGLFRRIVKSDPTLLFANGIFLDAELRGQRVAHEEVRSAVRQHGFQHLSQVGAVVLETDGSFSVLGRDLDVRLLAQVRPAPAVERHFGPITAE